MSKAYENGVLDERKRVEKIIDDLIKETNKKPSEDFANGLSEIILSTIGLKILLYIKNKIKGE